MQRIRGFPQSQLEERYDAWNGMGTAKFTRTYHRDYSLKTTNKIEVAKNPNLNDFTVFIFGHLNFLENSKDVTYKIWMEHLFDHNPSISDYSIRKGDPMAAIGSFVMDPPKGFTKAGAPRINDSIRTSLWAILGAQAQARSSILGVGKAFDAQRIFLANVEDAINSAVDLPDSIDRYQRTLQYAQSKLDFVVVHGLYILPSNMDLHDLNGYNNLIQIATDDMPLGYN